MHYRCSIFSPFLCLHSTVYRLNTLYIFLLVLLLTLGPAKKFVVWFGLYRRNISPDRNSLSTATHVWWRGIRVKHVRKWRRVRKWSDIENDRVSRPPYIKHGRDSNTGGENDSGNPKTQNSIFMCCIRVICRYCRHCRPWKTRILQRMCISFYLFHIPLILYRCGTSHVYI